MAWVDARRAVPTQAHVAAYAQQLCEHEAVNAVLGEWVILRARVEAGRGMLAAAGAGAGAGSAAEFYLLSKRGKQHATPQEIEAARSACERVLADGEARSAGKDIVGLASGLIAQYYVRMAARLSQAGGGGGGGEGVESVPELERVDDGPTAERGCYDRHPQCAYWAKMVRKEGGCWAKHAVGQVAWMLPCAPLLAAPCPATQACWHELSLPILQCPQGECSANPIYMTGADSTEQGWCSRACGTCTPPAPPRPEFDLDAAASLRSLSTDLLGVLHSKGCITSPACQWAGGEGAAALLAKQASGDAAAMVQVGAHARTSRRARLHLAAQALACWPWGCPADC